MKSGPRLRGDLTAKQKDILFELENAVLDVFVAGELAALANDAPSLSPSARHIAVDGLCEKIGAFKEQYYRLFYKPSDWRKRHAKW